MKILVRLGSDVTTKSDKIRARFVTRLLRNSRAALVAEGIEAQFERQWSRIFVDSDDPRILEVLSRIYGVSSLSPIDFMTEATSEAIVATALGGYRDLVRGKSFAVRARRTGNHPFDSMDLMREVGKALRPSAARVDLSKPEVVINVEVREDKAYLFSRRLAGPGGLPLGVSGKVLGLLSGGFDSAVATWMMQKRGLEVELLFFNLAGSAYERSVLTIAKYLAARWSYGVKAKLHILDFSSVAAEIKERVKPSFAQVVLKRCFYRAAERLAIEVGAEALLTGECIGQVSSQTLTNLCSIGAAISMPVLRPLIGWNKEEIMAEARQIGTYDLCAAVQEYCQLVADKPVTAASRTRLDGEEQNLNPAWIDCVFASHRTLLLGELEAIDLVTPFLYIDKIPDGAVVIDCRSEGEYAAGHYPGAIHLEVHDLMTRIKTLEKRATYVLYCPLGLQSAVGAEQLQKAGYEAYSLKGGARSIMESIRASE